MISENQNIKNISKMQKEKISIEAYFTKWDISKYCNLLIYNSDNNIINDEIYLANIIGELNNLIEDEYEQVLIPYLCPPCHKLLESYINSNLDENENIKSLKDFKYIHIFEKLKNNIFINRENISLIYSYFGSLFYEAKEIEEDDKRLSKFLKLKELWKIFYNLSIDEKEKNKSNFSFIGGSLEFKLEEKLNFLNNKISVKINFIQKNLDKMLNDNVNFLKLNDTVIDINNDLKQIRDINKLTYIEFQIGLNKIFFSYKLEGKDTMNGEIKRYKKFDNIDTITILENFYGQIQSIEITIKNNILEEKSFHNLYYPVPTNSKDELFNIKSNYLKDKDNYYNIKKLCFDEGNMIDLTLKKEKKDYSLTISNNLFVKINFINYNEKNFNIIEYFGGIIQLLPFIGLIKNLYENEKIKIINNQNKIDILASFVSYIICSFIDIISYYNEYKKKINKYFLFFIYLLSELDISLILKNYKIIEDSFKKLDNNFQTNSKFRDSFYYLINTKKTGNNKEFLSFLTKLDESIYTNTIDNFEYFFEQFYTKLMKELFIYNRNWSKKELFFKIDKKKDFALKYKQLSYYTKSFQQPLIYPILEIEKYYPKFKGFNKEKLYKNSEEKIINYDFSLNGNDIIKDSIKKIIKSKSQNKIIEFEKCCLVKKIYHVKGKLGIIKDEGNNKKSFKLIFISNDKEMNYTCNKEFINMNEQNQNDTFEKKNQYLCYGSISQCPKKEYNRKIIINSENILFLLIREYLHRVSAIEIFTNNNKSYYFNFNKKFEAKIKNSKSNNNKNKNNNEINNNIKNDLNSSDENDEIEIEKTSIKDIQNIIILNINRDIFKPIIRQKILLGFYNNKYERCFYPLFKEKKIHLTEFKTKFFSNFDILIFVNLFSNRSFKDLYQYPIFPMFYNTINNERVMNKHIAFQNFDSQTNKRIEQIIETYETALEDNNEDGENSKKVALFNTFYSNPVYTSNFLLRVFPYSLSCIELQGSGFDNPNRLFYAIDSFMDNTLSQKSDLRELIPEFFYFFELFKNRNNLEFNKTDDNYEIDNVKIHLSDKNETEQNKYLFISQLRNKLEKGDKLNEWIDLIFGIKSEKDQNDRLYYSKESITNFENNEKIINDKYIMSTADFGLIPFKLYKSKFPPIKKDNIDKLKTYNNNSFDNGHSTGNLNPMKTCICIGRTTIEKDYINLYKKKIEKLKNKLKNLKQLDEFYFYFVGDIFGGVTIYQINVKNPSKKYSIKNKIKNISSNVGTGIKNTFNKIFKTKKHSFEQTQIKGKKEEEENNNEWFDVDLEFINETEGNEDKKIYDAKLDGIYEDINYEVTIFNKLYDHNEVVKYIDYNGRLNLFVTYALDGFINLYLFPSCKLVNSIKVTNIVGKDIFDKIFLISTPFPMIGCINNKLLYIFDINGNFIHSEPVINDGKIKIHIDKNCGIVPDFITKNGKEYYFPFIKEKSDKA